MGDNNWLKALKAGDKVYVISNGLSGGQYRLNTVQKVTSTGRIRVNGVLYRDGCYNAPGGWSGSKLEQHTPELENRFKTEAQLRHMCYEIKNVDVFKLSSDKVKKIYDIIKATEE